MPAAATCSTRRFRGHSRRACASPTPSWTAAASTFEATRRPRRARPRSKRCERARALKMKLLVYSARSRHGYALRSSSASASGRASTSSARNETEVVQETLGRALPLPPTATRSTVSASPRSVRAVPHGGDGAAHRLAMTSEGVDAYVGEHVVHKWVSRREDAQPVVPQAAAATPPCRTRNRRR